MNKDIFFIVAIVAAFFISLTIALLIIKYRYGLDKAIDEKSHAMHTHEVSRMGGLAIVISMLLCGLIFSPLLVYMSIAGTAIFVFAFLEDKYHFDLPYTTKLFFITLASMTILYLTKQYAFDGGFIFLDSKNLAHLTIAYSIALVGIVGFASAINFIDGLNGYASGVIIITLSFFCIELYDANATELLMACLITIGAVLGFFVLNFPFGRVFMGDMGAHLLGFYIGFLAIAMANVTAVSLWYPLAAFTIPIINTLQKFPRRIKRKKEFGIPFSESDSEDLHFFMFQYIKKRYPTIGNMALKNSIASLYILGAHLALNILAYLYRSDYFVLIAIFFGASICYVYTYKKMATKIKAIADYS